MVGSDESSEKVGQCIVMIFFFRMKKIKYRHGSLSELFRIRVDFGFDEPSRRRAYSQRLEIERILQQTSTPVTQANLRAEVFVRYWYHG